MEKLNQTVSCREGAKFCALPSFLPLCMECRRGLAMRKLSVRLSVRMTNALIVLIVTKRKKDLSRFLYRTKDHLA